MKRFELATDKQKNYVAYILGISTEAHWRYLGMHKLTKGQANDIIEAYKNKDYEYLKEVME